MSLMCNNMVCVMMLKLNWSKKGLLHGIGEVSCDLHESYAVVSC